MGTRNEDAAALAIQARNAWTGAWQAVRWDYWVRLEWRTEWIAEGIKRTRWLTAERANAHLERLITDLQRNGPTGHRHPTIRIVAGFHTDPYPHAHALVGLSRRLR